MSVNGFDDSKNKKEVYTKEEADVRYVLKGDFAVLFGKVTLEANEDVSSYVAKQTQWNVDYPSGFTKDNCVCIAFGGNKATNKGYGYGYLIESDLALALQAGVLPRAAILNSDNISCMALNPSSNANTFNYKLVLMKYEVLDSEYTLGDVNQDGQITQEDADITLAASVGNVALTAQQFKAADINKDGEIDTVDAARLQKYVSGELDSLE